MDRITRSFRLVAQSYRVLMDDVELILLPLASGAVMAVIVLVFVLGAGINAATIQARGPALYAPIFVLYVLMYAVGIFFQCAVVAGATERMNGGDPTVMSSLQAAGRRIGSIVMWAVFAATVGVLLRAIQDRVGFIGKLVVGLVGAAWSLATFFVVPVLVLEDLTVPEVLSRSVSLFKETWGEAVAGSAGLGIASFVAWLVLVAATALLAAVVGAPALILFGTGAILLTLFFTTLQGIYLASLYRFATTGEVADGFDRRLLTHAFVPKP